MYQRVGVLFVFAASFVVSLAAPLSAVEPAKAFLDGLRQRRYYDLAIEYLDTAPDNPAIPIQFKETLAYERGLTLVEGARWQRDPAIRDKWLDEGQKVLTDFVNSQKASLQAVSARSQLANVMVERAKTRLEKSRKQTGAAKDQLLTESRQLFSDAIKIFEGQVNETREQVKKYPASLQPKDGKPFEDRAYYRTEYLQARMLVVAAKEEMAETHAKGSPEYTKLITDCAEGYKAIHDDYRTLLAGMFARAYQARCLQKLGKHKEALGYFNELIAQPDNSDLHDMRVLAISLAIDSWIADKLYKEIMEKAYPVVDKARPNEDRTDEFMEMRVKIARAFKLYADQLKAESPRDPLIRQLLTRGRELVLYVARFNSPYQEQARRLVADFAGADPDAIATDKPQPKTFIEARDAGTDAITKMTNSDLLVKQVEARLPTITDAGERSQLQKQVEEAKTAAAEARAAASGYWKLALKLADANTSVDDLNLARYMACFLAYAEGRYYDAVVLGEFIAQRYPDSQGARQSAKIAMASWLKIYSEAGTDNEFESQRIIDIADYIVKKWPDQPEAADALNTLIPFMIREKKLQQALDYMNKIPPDSPHRGTAELKTGQALWASYLDNARQIREWEQDTSQMPQGTDLAARKKELEDLKTKAQTALQDGVARMQAAGEMTSVGATAVLSLAQILLDTNQPDKSIAMLEDPKVGSLTLIKQNHPATQKEGFDVETYKTALRAYISSLGTTNDPQALIDKAKQMMETLKAAMGEAGQAKLVAIYVSLARDLQTQMELADDNAKMGLAKGFEAFLKEVAAEATEANVLYWVADTYRAMGESFLSSGREGRAAAKPHLEAAIATYQKILEQVSKNPSSSSTLPTQIRLQMARTYRSMARFKEAIDQFEAVLKPASGRFLLPVQIEAAQTYQEWGGYGPDFRDRYGDAILGARPDKENADKAKRTERIIWGWGLIATKTAGNPKYDEQFHQARYNLALCRYRWAQAEKDARLKAERLKQAKADIALTVALYSNLGGAKWEGQYDKLLRDVQTSLGEQPVGLQALRRAQNVGDGVPVKTGGRAPGSQTPAARPKSTPTVKPTITNTSTN